MSSRRAPRIRSDGSPCELAEFACCSPGECLCPYREALYLKYRNPIVQFLARRLRQKADADDVAQESFLKCFSILRCDGARCPFGEMLYQVARCAADDHNHLARHRALSLEEIDPRNGGEERSIDDLVARLVVRQAMQQLSRDDRRLLVLHCVMRYSSAEIAERLALREATVIKRLQRAKRSLKSLLLKAGFTGYPETTGTAGGGDMQQFPPSLPQKRTDRGRARECRRIQEMIDGGVDDVAVSGHVAECERCAAHLRENGKLRSLVKKSLALPDDGDTPEN